MVLRKLGGRHEDPRICRCHSRRWLRRNGEGAVVEGSRDRGGARDRAAGRSRGRRVHGLPRVRSRASPRVGAGGQHRRGRRHRRGQRQHRADRRLRDQGDGASAARSASSARARRRSATASSTSATAATRRCARSTPTSLAKGACVTLDSMPDGLAYVAATNEVWVTTPRDKSIRILDARSPARRSQGDASSSTASPRASRSTTRAACFYTNLEDKDRTLADRHASPRRSRRRGTPGCGEDGPKGLALDDARALLFVACADKVEVLDAARQGALGARRPATASTTSTTSRRATSCSPARRAPPS